MKSVKKGCHILRIIVESYLKIVWAVWKRWWKLWFYNCVFPFFELIFNEINVVLHFCVSGKLEKKLCFTFDKKLPGGLSDGAKVRFPGILAWNIFAGSSVADALAAYLFDNRLRSWVRAACLKPSEIVASLVLIRILLVRVCVMEWTGTLMDDSQWKKAGFWGIDNPRGAHEQWQDIAKFDFRFPNEKVRMAHLQWMLLMMDGKPMVGHPAAAGYASTLQ